jgi:hypothetical protein
MWSRCSAVSDARYRGLVGRYAGQLAKQDGRTTFLINFVDGEVSSE